MVRGAQGAGASLERVRVVMVEGLRARRQDFEQATLARTYAVSDPGDAADPEYADGLRAAISSALDYGLAALEWGEERSPPIPAALLGQARLAARNSVNLDTVLRRYFAGYTLLGDFLIQVAEEEGIHNTDLQLLIREQATLFDRLIEAVTEEFVDEANGLPYTSDRRRAERVQRLLGGELLDTSEFEYDFEGNHLGAIASGPDAPHAVRSLAAEVDRRLLAVRRNDSVVWAWLGGRRKVDEEEIECLSSLSARLGISLSVGEPGRGFAGWRRTHDQARAAWSIALRSPTSCTRYREVALLASILADDLLATSLRELYMLPLSHDRDGGRTLRQALRAYFAADRNVSSAAAALGVGRQTLINRLRSVEERIQQPIADCVAALESALRVEELSDGLPRRLE